MKIAILGAGLIGRKRGQDVGAHQLAGLYDPDSARAAKLASELRTISFPDPASLLAAGADIAIVATTNDQLAPVALRALAAGCHLLLEKPGATSVAELEKVAAAAKKAGRAVKVGFNHRFHPATLKLRELVDAGALGPLMFLRARYGHGGRLGMEKEWRMLPERGGGGELLDQGVHVLDLIHWFFGPLPLQSSLVTTSYWDAAVEDNAVLTLSTGKPRAPWATFHVSCSEWKNLYALELYGRSGKALVEGITGSYGKAKLTYYRMLPQMGPPEIETFEYADPDDSWRRDLENLVAHIEKGAPLLGDLASARYALEQVRAAYRQNGFTNLPCSV